MSEARPHLELDGVTVAFGGTPALEDLSLSVGRGEQLALVGPSGAGKTTLLRLLNGSLRTGRGSVRIEGVRLETLSPPRLRKLQTKIGFVHQALSLVPNLSVLQNVVAGRLGSRSLMSSLRSFVLPRRDEVERVYDLLCRVGIPEKLFQRADRLSGGQRQRVAIARALYQGGTTILADEPVSSVDPARARATVELLTSICRESGLTLCVSLHNLALARDYFPRLVGLRRGRIVLDRQPDQLGKEQFMKLYRLSSHELRVRP